VGTGGSFILSAGPHCKIDCVFHLPKWQGEAFPGCTAACCGIFSVYSNFWRSFSICMHQILFWIYSFGYFVCLFIYDGPFMHFCFTLGGINFHKNFMSVGGRYLACLYLSCILHKLFRIPFLKKLNSIRHEGVLVL